jgi:hypothetical protein
LSLACFWKGAPFSWEVRQLFVAGRRGCSSELALRSPVE